MLIFIYLLAEAPSPPKFPKPSETAAPETTRTSGKEYEVVCDGDVCVRRPKTVDQPSTSQAPMVVPVVPVVTPTVPVVTPATAAPSVIPPASTLAATTSVNTHSKTPVVTPTVTEVTPVIVTSSVIPTAATPAVTIVVSTYYKIPVVTPATLAPSVISTTVVSTS